MAINMSYFAGAGAQFFDDNGAPLAGGKLYTYSAGTTTPAVTYTTRAGTVNNTNPIILDAAGRTPQEIWFNGGLLYKFVLKSSTDVLIGTYDNISSINDVSQNGNLITVTGTNNLTGTSVAPITSYSVGYQVSFVAVATNTGAMSIDIDGVGAKSIVTDVSTPLVAGDIPAGKVVYIEYDGTRFQVINPSAFNNARVAGTLRVQGAINAAQGANIPSAATLDLTSATGNFVHVTGTTGITAITLAQGYQRTVTFDGVLTLTNSANLILPNNRNITTAAGDSAIFIGDAGGVVKCVSYTQTSPTVVFSDGNTQLYPSVPVRQTVVSGPVDSSGYPSFGGSTGSTTVTASGTLVATAASGASNRMGTITNPSWTSLSTNGTMYLYLDIAVDNTCTTGSTTLAPVYQWGGTYSTTNNQATFNIQEMTMKVGNGTTAAQTFRVFVGEVTVAGGVTTAITWYALMGRYVGPATAMPTAATVTNYNHNIGCIPKQSNYILILQSNVYGYTVGDEIPNPLWYLGGGNFTNLFPALDRLTAKSMANATCVGNVYFMNKSTGASSTIATATDFKYRIECARGW